MFGRGTAAPGDAHRGHDHRDPLGRLHQGGRRAWGAEFGVGAAGVGRGADGDGGAEHLQHQAHAFGDEGLAAAITWGHYAESMLANMFAYDRARELVKQLATALENRPVIDQAKGIVMRDRGCTAEEAFDLLVSASQRTNRKLRLVAQDIVESVGGPI